MPELSSLPLELAPVALFLAYVVASLVAFGVRHAVHGRWHDEEIAGRGESALLPMWMRMYFSFAIHPLWLVAKGSRMPANAITTLSALLSFATGFSVADGRFALGGWLYLLAGLCDFLDGRVARSSHTAGKRGAAIDSIVDRYSDAAVLLGLGWYFRESWLLLVTMTALVGTMLVSYVRARGEGLGVDVRVGLMQRPERVVLLGAALTVSPLFPWLTGQPERADVTITAALLFIAAGTQWTAAHRFLHLVRALSPRHAEHPPGGDDPRTTEQRGNARRMLRAIVSAFVATSSDLLLVMALVASTAPAWLATGLGCVLGAAINFSLNRVWTFASQGAPVPQAARYTLVSVTSALLNAGGVALLLLVPWPDYRLAWLVVRGIVFLLWNYPLQRDYVYGSAVESGSVDTPRRSRGPRSPGPVGSAAQTPAE